MPKNIYDTLPKAKSTMSTGDMGSTENELEDMESSKPEGSGAPHEMMNKVRLEDHCFAGAKDGESVSGKVEGTVVHEDGGRFFVVQKIDGYPVKGMGPQESEEDSESNAEPPRNMGEAFSDFRNQNA